MPVYKLYILLNGKTTAHNGLLELYALSVAGMALKKLDPNYITISIVGNISHISQVSRAMNHANLGFGWVAI